MPRLNKYKMPDRVCQVIDGLNHQRPAPTRDIIHVTDLLMPAYARNLLVDKYNELEVDYSDWLISCQGDALHEAYQKYLFAIGYHCEMRMEEEINGVKLTGTLDAYNKSEEILVDLKQTSVWGPSYKIEDYTKQTNCYAWMLGINKHKVKKIYIDIWYRNWQLKQAGWSKDYPKIPYERINIDVWPLEKTECFIAERIDYLLNYKGKCSREDKWQKYSVMKNKNKTPSRNCSTTMEAAQWIDKYKIDNSKKKDKFTVVDSPPTSCLHYCSARSVCDYAKSLK